MNFYVKRNIAIEVVKEEDKELAKVNSGQAKKENRKEEEKEEKKLSNKKNK